MRLPRLIPVAALFVAGLAASACANRPRVPVVTSSVSSASCNADIEVANVADWKTVESEGFTFCVPQHWQLDNQYLRVQATRRNPTYRVLSWGSPDSTEQVVFEIPRVSGARDILKMTLANCKFEPVVRAEFEVQGQTVCTTGHGQQSTPARDLTVIFPDPLMRVRLRGFRNPYTVVETVRPRLSTKVATDP